MRPELLIAIVSGLLTLLASSLVAIYQARTEFQKMLKQLEQKYTTSLFEKRLEAYPLLYQLLHTLNHEIEYNVHNQGEIDRQNLIEFQHHYDHWIATSAFLLTPTTAELVWGYHNYLIDILGQTSEQSLSEKQWIEVRNIQATIGKCLRAELGVYDTRAAGIFKSEPYVHAMIERLNQSSRRIRNRFDY
ncbi:hypothetical protein PN498_19410 [Oscillatoria sp. CS-180]|uniref:hypothetical protein n=1 Tax=Oscillatoria sp. CS-180 TaxID=3021720 RepID=UPI002330BEC0|nr:hypothetical protein [Oscillatoria sp. CS-180]MDB9528169.1 hypothetical protein [Oscillatoria sp. CS-180]